MDLLDYATLLAKRHDYAGIELLGVLRGNLVFALNPVMIDESGHTPFLVGSNKDDLHFDTDAAYHEFAKSQAERDRQPAEQYIDNLEREKKIRVYIDLGANAASAIDIRKDFDRLGYMKKSSVDKHYGFNRFQFSDIRIRGEVEAAIERFSAEKFNPERSPRLKRETHPRRTNYRMWKEGAEEAFDCLLDMIGLRLANNPLSYRDYGPYWPSIKTVLINNDRLPAGEVDFDIANAYIGDNDLETLVKGECFRDNQLKQGQSGRTAWRLRDDSKRTWKVTDVQMETVRLDRNRLLNRQDPPELEERLNELRPCYGLIFHLGYYNDVSVFAFEENGQIIRDEMIMGDTVETLEYHRGPDVVPIIENLRKEAPFRL